MANDSSFPHLALAPTHIGRAKFSGGGKTNPITESNLNNRPQHYERLSEKLSDLSTFWKSRHQERELAGLPEIPKSVPILLKVNPDGFDVDTFLSKNWGLEVVCEMDDGFIIVISEDLELSLFFAQLDKFLSHEYGGGNVANVHEVVHEEDLRSRIERILSEDLLNIWPSLETNSEITVEISIECLGKTKLPKGKSRQDYETDRGYEKHLESVSEALQAYDEIRFLRENELEKLVNAYNGEICEMWDKNNDPASSFSDSFTVLIKISGNGLKDIAQNYPYVFEIALIEPLSEIVQSVVFKSSDERVEFSAPPTNSSAVVIIDSGIQESHRLIENGILKQYSKNFFDGTANTNDDISHDGGHGTRVAGITLFPSGIPTVNSQLPFWIINAKILDTSGQIPENILPAKALSEIVNHYCSRPEKDIRIFNHSIASRGPARKRYMSSWASMIEELTYGTDALIIQASGNVSISDRQSFSLGVREHIAAGREYPYYLYDPSCRIANPGQSFNALTVGSISFDEFKDSNFYSIGPQNGPSPFSRTGFGIWGVIKPDVVEFGGNLVRSNGANPLVVKQIPETSLRTVRRSPPAIDSSAIGTSFAAPKVTNLVARIQNEFPTQSTLLYRGLIAQSAKWPDWFPNLDGVGDLEKLKHFGYGVPDADLALRNNKNRITFFTEGRTSISAKEIHYYEIPIPDQIRSVGSEFDILIEITLSYTAKPRRTRKNLRKYLSTWLDWVTSNRGESRESFYNRTELLGDKDLTTNSEPIPWTLQHKTKDGQIKSVSRSSGTLQKDWATVKPYQLEDSFSVAVRGHEGWDSLGNHPAQYVLIISFEIIGAELELYNLVTSEIESRTSIEIPLSI